MQNLFSVVIIIFLSLNLGFAQGSVQFNESVEVKTLMNDFIIKNRQKTKIRGWRIQLISTPNRRSMDGVRAKFASKYPAMRVTWKHVSPNYQVRIGAYNTKAELMNFLLRLRRDFPMAIPITDDIDKIDLIP